MKRAFIIKLDIEPTTDLSVVAEEIKEAVEEEGHLVLSVAPYAAPEQIATDIAEIQDQAQGGTSSSPLGGSLF